MALRRCIVRDADVLRCQHRMRRLEHNAGRWDDVSCPAALLSCQQCHGHASKVRQQRGTPYTPRVRTVPARQNFRCVSLLLFWLQFTGGGRGARWGGVKELDGSSIIYGAGADKSTTH
jgi:hypothetical protein